MLVLVVAGAGASKAVNATHYPTTVEFVERLPRALRADPLIDALFGYQSACRKGPYDVEALLGDLDALRLFANLVTNRDSPVGHLLSSPSRFGEALGHAGNSVGGLASLSDIARTKINSLEDSLWRHVYELYGHDPEPGDLEKTWVSLIAKLLTNEVRLEVVTTNYDLVLESLAGLTEHTGSPFPQIEEMRKARAMETPLLSVPSRQSMAHRILDVDEWRGRQGAARPPKSKGLITKLHGSINWTRRPDGSICIGDTHFTNDHGRHVIMYPGDKRVPVEEPFARFHAHFESLLAHADAVIFIGFAFRDAGINALLARAVRPTTRLCVVDVRRPPDCPFPPGRVFHAGAGAGFSEESVAAAVEYIGGSS